MKKVILASALTLFFAVLFTGIAAAQDRQNPPPPTRLTPAIAPGGEGAEVCVNASNVDYAKGLFPKAAIHVIPDNPNPLLNGWRLVYGTGAAAGKIMTDAQEIQLRQQEGRGRLPLDSQ